MQNPLDPYRLPTTVVPARYDLQLAPDLSTFRFDGVVDVQLIVSEPTNVIVMNAVEIEFVEGWLLVGDERVEVAEFRVEPDTERVHLHLASSVPAGDATLHIVFIGEVNDRLKGFYRSTYTDEEGVEHIVATTQCEPTDARSAFPCWDEPAFKAIFGLTLIVPEGLAAFANGPEIASQDLDDGRRRVTFADTMVMSTYLIAWTIGRLEVTEPVVVDGVPIRVIHVPGKANLTSFALDIAAASLAFFTEYYGIAYPETKLDMAALPDFAAGAMENPGLVTFREAALLVDPKRSTMPEQQRIAETTAHEIAHMWFGDLVTMRWWNGIWLNEAFATFMALLAVDDWKPEWKVFESFALSRSEAFEVDGLQSTRSIEYEVISPDDVEDMFDVLTYEKGGAVLWMLEQHLGRERFRDGIRAYLAAHAYGNTETHDLWDALEEVTGEPVRRVMDAWIWQGGYPLVTVTLEPDSGGVRLSQQRFTYAGTDDGTRWPVPYRVRQVAPGGEATTERVLLEADGAVLSSLAADAQVVGNAEATSFVRTRYEGVLLDRIATREGLSPLERFVLVDDTWASVLAGALPATAFCGLVQGFGDETEAPVWKAILGGLSWCDRLLDGASREGLQAFVRELAGPALARVGWEPGAAESDLDRDLRGTLVRSLGLLGRDGDVIERAVAIERASRAGDPVDGPTAAASLAIAASVGSAEEWEAFAGMYRDGDTPQTQRRYIQSLSLFPQPGLVEPAFAKLLDGYVRSQDRPFVIGGFLASRDHGPAAWELVKSNWDGLMENLTAHLRVYAVEAVRVFSTPALREDVVAFFEAHPLPGAGKMLEHCLERQGVAVALREREAASLAAALAPGGSLRS